MVFDFGAAQPTALAAGREHSCAALDDRSVVCWGDGLFRRLGFNPCSGENPSCLHPNDGALVTTESRLCFPKRGAVGDEGCEAFTPDELREPVALALGDRHTCALLAWDDEDPDIGERAAVRCWGFNDKGVLGLDEKGPHDARAVDDLEFDCAET